MNLMTADRASLEALHQELLAKFEACKAKGLKLDMSRGKPSKAQLDLCEDMLTVLSKNADLMDGKTDTRNYGGLEMKEILIKSWSVRNAGGKELLPI